jgi:hypothetical protein
MIRSSSLNCCCAALSITSLLAGCANPQPDYGPFPSNYDEIIHSYLHTHLKDPYSIQEPAVCWPHKWRVRIRLAFLRDVQLKEQLRRVHWPKNVFGDNRR